MLVLPYPGNEAGTAGPKKQVFLPTSPYPTPRVINLEFLLKKKKEKKKKLGRRSKFTLNKMSRS